MEEYKELTELLTKIRKNPLMYIGKNSLELLSAYVNGYIHGKNCNGFYEGFQEWIEKRFCINTSHHWSSIISFFCGSEAIGAFYELLDEFLSQQENKYNRK